MAEVGRRRAGEEQGEGQRGASAGTRIALNSDISLGAALQPRYGKPAYHSYSAKASLEAMHVVAVAADDAGARYIDSDEDDVPGLVSVSHNSFHIVGGRQAPVAAKPRGATIRAFTSQPPAQDSAPPAEAFMAATQVHS